MTNRRHITGQQIGFLTKQAPASPFPPSPYGFPPSASLTPPSFPASPFPNMGNMNMGNLPAMPHMPNMGNMAPLANTLAPATSSTPGLGGAGGLGGLLQGLLKGQGSLDIGSLMTNAQKMIGIINQVGAIAKNITPILGMFKGADLAESLADIDENATVRTRKRKNKKKKKESTRKRGTKKRSSAQASVKGKKRIKRR